MVFDKFNEFNYIESQLLDQNCSKEETGILLKEFTNILFECSKQCFKLAKISKPRNKPKSKPWYNNECQEMRKRLLNLARLLKKKPSDPYIRGKFVICKREYRKMMRENKRTFEVANLDKIQSLTTTPKQFWKCIKNNLGKSKHNR